jgi:hypothetical protein
MWATQRQKEFAELINLVTGIPLPDVPTKLNYHIYISQNLQNYKDVIQERKRRRRIVGRRIVVCTNVNHHRPNYLNNTPWIPDEEQDSDWAAAMDFSWM